ncbi:hypothetical protein EYR41_002709 [Orbilia oligospora]|uniref:Uncharacterized protein n=1 Tax=Orbilia oligospora TaxID=2813651 RepID=A0A7C8PB03_ORBOL|nr:hypothetical protein TWF751_008871 [Orbilia oligospora]KAF3284026.1 hypothetical protein TWF132_009914 [Orbilia oligospora]TGJ70677.1 hypothetical protein EYR41_002709 [Orbilia oligospora]
MNRRSVLGLPGGLTMLNINTDLASNYSRRRRDRTSFDSIEYDSAQLLDYQHPAPQAHQDPDQEVDLLNDDSHLPLPPWIPPPPTPPQPVYRQAGKQQMMKGLDLDRKSTPELRELYKDAGNTPVGSPAGSPATPWENESPRLGTSWATSPSTPRLGSFFSNTCTPTTPRSGTSFGYPTTPKSGTSFGYSPSTPRPGASAWATSPSTPRPGTSYTSSTSTPRPGTSYTNNTSTTRPGTSYTNSPTTPRPGTAFSLLSRDTSIGTLPEDIPLTIMVTKTVSLEFETVANRKAIDSADYRTICDISYIEPGSERAGSSRGCSSDKSVYLSEEEEEKEEVVREMAKVIMPSPVKPEENRYGYGVSNNGIVEIERKQGQGLGMNTNETVEFLKKFGVTPKKVVGAVKKVRNMFGRV